MVDPFLPAFTELFENPQPEGGKVTVKQETTSQADEEMK